MKTSAISEFLKEIYSVKDLSVLIDKLDQIREKNFKIGESFEKKVEAVFADKYGQVFLNILGEENISLKDPIAVLEFIDGFRKGLKQLPIVRLKLAFLPTKNTLALVSEWFSGNLGGKAILDVEVDPKILGGVVILTGGLYKDYSLSAKIDRVETERMGQFQ